jgi:N-acetyl-gamma-glutamyl-phosphate reductase
MDAGIVGAPGYTGAELLRLLADHPALKVQVATADSHAGSRAADLFPSLAAAYPQLAFTATDPAELEGLDVVFLAMPHGQAQALVPELVGRVGHLIDLSADFRLRDPSLYLTWYGAEHTAPDLLGQFAFGLPELFRDTLAGAHLVAAPGCYVTAAAIALAPFTRGGVVETDGIIVDAASGTSGAGRSLRDNLHFSHVHDDFSAYGLLDHRHTPEIEQAIGAQVLFTPHLAPMARGILATCYARPSELKDTAAAMAVLRAAYESEPFVVVSQAAPGTKATLGSNCVQVTARVDARTGWLVVLAALDNLVKGASGQALQCANLALGLPETTGLPLAGLYP